MQGRFVVLFTAADTGLVNQSGNGTPNAPAVARRASWVLIVSNWATGCQGSGGGFTSTCIPNPTPAVPGGFANTEFFTTPQPPGPNQGSPNVARINAHLQIYYSAVPN